MSKYVTRCGKKQRISSEEKSSISWEKHTQRSVSATLPAREEIHLIRSSFALIKGTLLQDANIHSQLIRQLDSLTLRWENEIVPLADQLILKQSANPRALVHFKESTELMVRDIDLFVKEISNHNRSEILRFNHRRIFFVLLFLPIFTGIAYYTRKHLITPIIALQEASQYLIEGNFNIRLPVICRNEVGLLTDRFNQTAAALGNLFAANKDYSKTLDELNRASSKMISMGSRGEIYQFACDTMRELLSMDMVWLGLIEPPSSQVKKVACTGDESGYTAELVITCDDAPTGNGPMGMAIKNRKPFLANIQDESFRPWRDRAQRHGVKSMLVMPLVTNHDCLGAIALYSTKPDFFNHEQIELCQIFANHTSAAIEAMNLLQYVVFALARAAEVNDEDTGNHIMRVGEYCAILAKEMGLDSAFVEQLRFEATLHDVGKLYLDPAILKKHGPLTPEEWEIMRLHTSNGAKIIGEHPMLQMAREVAQCHHERWDGTGYPIGLQGEQIPLSARIISIADQYDALRTPRVYKPAFDHRKTCKIIMIGDGRTRPEHFDPHALGAFIRISHRFDEIYERLA